MDEVMAVFVHEVHEKLDEMEAGLLALEQGNADDETLNGIFRAAHTIKGSSGVVELTAIEEFTHVLENLLDQLREQKISPNPTLIGHVLQGCDYIRLLVENIPALQSGDLPQLRAHGEVLAAQLESMLLAPGQCANDNFSDADDTTQADAIVVTDSSDRLWHVSIRFGLDVLQLGMDPAAFIQQLNSLGEIRHCATVFDTMPSMSEMNPEACYMGLEIGLQSEASLASIQRVFDFIADDCQLFIMPPGSPLSSYQSWLANFPNEAAHLLQILQAFGTLDAASLAHLQGESSEPQNDTVETQAIQSATAYSPAANSNKRPTQESKLLRVDAEKLDRLIDLVGELVIAGASTQLLARHSGQTALTEAAAVMSRLVEGVRDSALQLRMVTIGETFNRFQRVVRDCARETGKQINLSITGGQTELDKTVVEGLADPLLHLIRNSIDHGIESPTVRLEKGKPESGTVSLKAYHDSGSVVIEISDDGNGLNTERIRQKAIERGLIEAGQVLSEHEIHMLIFEPGFSTAEQVTNLSGRGVGMDVVKKNIGNLRGSIEAHSQAGQGSRFVLRLPLTLAIIDGFLVSIGKASYVIPLNNVVECLELRSDEAQGNVLHLRGKALPFLRLREQFTANSQAPRRENVVVVQAAGHRAGIVVDQLHGEFQTVIKPLSSLFRHLQGVAGSTIIGSGEVALILDVQSLIRKSMNNEMKHHHGLRLAQLAPSA